MSNDPIGYIVGGGLKEGFYIRGSAIHYYADKDAWLAVLPKDGGKTVFVNNVKQIIETNYGEVTGVLVNK